MLKFIYYAPFYLFINIDLKNFICKNDLCIMRDRYKIYQSLDDLPIIISLYIILVFYQAIITLGMPI